MREYSDTIHENFRKLEFFVSGAKETIILIDVNSIQMREAIIAHLSNNKEFIFVDFQNIRADYLGYIRCHQSGKEAICIYNYSSLDSYDLIKTMNLSRELFRKVGLLILLMPSYLCDEIRFQYDNLYSYIQLTLDFNTIELGLVEPIYSENFKYFVPKNLSASNKRITKRRGWGTIDGIDSYYYLLDGLLYEKLNDENRSIIYEALGDVLRKVANSPTVEFGDNDELLSAYEDLYIETATFFIKKRDYEGAIHRFEELIKKNDAMAKRQTVYIESFQGIAFCYYLLRKYYRAFEYLEIIKKRIENIDNPIWLAKIYNDMGACVFCDEDLDKALEYWQFSRKLLLDNEGYNFERSFRYYYNITLYYVANRANPNVYRENWTEVGQTFLRIGSEQSIERIEYLHLDSWIDLTKGRFTDAKTKIDEAIMIGNQILPEYSEYKNKLRKLKSCIKESEMGN